jgi:ABC-2 type transport system ATP-binding protein
VSASLLDIRGLSKTYNKQSALSGLDLAVDAGELVGFIGPNGAGKTTTIKIAAGLAFADSGTVTIAGHRLEGNRPSTRAAKSALGLLPDRPYLYDKLTGREYLFFVAGLYGVPRAKAAAHLAMMSERFKMDDYLDRTVDGMSHGMKQKVALAAALVHAPPVFICDEPLVGLDPHGAKAFTDLLRELRAEGRAILMSSHTLHHVDQVCDRVVLLFQGRKVAEGTPAELKSRAGSEALEEAFLQMTAEDAEKRLAF